MGERDAFGRDKDEDSLSALGWTSSLGGRERDDAVEWTATGGEAPAWTAAPDAAGATSEAASAAEPEARAWAPATNVVVTTRRGRRGVLLGPVIALVVAGAVFAGGASLVSNAGDAIDDFSTSIREAVPTTAPPEVPAAEAEEPAPAEAPSLLRSSALKAALAELPKGEIQLLRVAPDRINAQMVVKGKLHSVQVGADGEVMDVATPSTGLGSGPVKIVTAAPSRIVRTATKRTGRKASSVDYLALLNIGGESQWQLFFKDGLHFSASANGKKVRRVG